MYKQILTTEVEKEDAYNSHSHEYANHCVPLINLQELNIFTDFCSDNPDEKEQDERVLFGHSRYYLSKHDTNCLIHGYLRELNHDLSTITLGNIIEKYVGFSNPNFFEISSDIIPLALLSWMPKIALFECELNSIINSSATINSDLFFKVDLMGNDMPYPRGGDKNLNFLFEIGLISIRKNANGINVDNCQLIKRLLQKKINLVNHDNNTYFFNHRKVKSIIGSLLSWNTKIIKDTETYTDHPDADGDADYWDENWHGLEYYGCSLHYYWTNNLKYKKLNDYNLKYSSLLDTNWNSNNYNKKNRKHKSNDWHYQIKRYYCRVGAFVKSITNINDNDNAIDIDDNNGIDTKMCDFDIEEKQVMRQDESNFEKGYLFEDRAYIIRPCISGNSQMGKLTFDTKSIGIGLMTENHSLQLKFVKNDSNNSSNEVIFMTDTNIPTYLLNDYHFVPVFAIYSPIMLNFMQSNHETLKFCAKFEQVDRTKPSFVRRHKVSICCCLVFIFVVLMIRGVVK